MQYKIFLLIFLMASIKNYCMEQTFNDVTNAIKYIHESFHSAQMGRKDKDNALFHLNTLFEAFTRKIAFDEKNNSNPLTNISNVESFNQVINNENSMVFNNYPNECNSICLAICIDTSLSYKWIEQYYVPPYYNDNHLSTMLYDLVAWKHRDDSKINLTIKTLLKNPHATQFTIMAHVIDEIRRKRPRPSVEILPLFVHYLAITHPIYGTVDKDNSRLLCMALLKSCMPDHNVAKELFPFLSYFVETLKLDPNIYVNETTQTTLLHWFTQASHGDAVALLQNAGADQSARDSQGKTPGDYAQDIRNETQQQGVATLYKWHQSSTLQKKDNAANVYLLFQKKDT